MVSTDKGKVNPLGRLGADVGGNLGVALGDSPLLRDAHHTLQRVDEEDSDEAGVSYTILDG